MTEQIDGRLVATVEKALIFGVEKTFAESFGFKLVSPHHPIDNKYVIRQNPLGVMKSTIRTKVANATCHVTVRVDFETAVGTKQQPVQRTAESIFLGSAGTKEPVCCGTTFKTGTFLCFEHTRKGRPRFYSADRGGRKTGRGFVLVTSTCLHVP
jgi:hypothetical protein